MLHPSRCERKKVVRNGTGFCHDPFTGSLVPDDVLGVARSMRQFRFSGRAKADELIAQSLKKMRLSLLFNILFLT